MCMLCFICCKRCFFGCWCAELPPEKCCRIPSTFPSRSFIREKNKRAEQREEGKRSALGVRAPVLQGVPPHSPLAALAAGQGTELAVPIGAVPIGAVPIGDPAGPLCVPGLARGGCGVPWAPLVLSSPPGPLSFKGALGPRLGSSANCDP